MDVYWIQMDLLPRKCLLEWSPDHGSLGAENAIRVRCGTFLSLQLPIFLANLLRNLCQAAISAALHPSIVLHPNFRAEASGWCKFLRSLAGKTGSALSSLKEVPFPDSFFSILDPLHRLRFGTYWFTGFQPKILSSMVVCRIKQLHINNGYTGPRCLWLVKKWPSWIMTVLLTSSTAPSPSYDHVVSNWSSLLLFPPLTCSLAFCSSPSPEHPPLWQCLWQVPYHAA